MMRDSLNVPSAPSRIDAMLDAAGIRLAEDDRRQLLEMYSDLWPSVEALYDVPRAQQEVPCLVFIADPPLASWVGG